MADEKAGRTAFLEKIFPNADLAVALGGLDCLESSTVATAEEALRKFREFGGAGWLCATGSETILRFGPEAPLPADGALGWPLEGEAVRGEESLHLGRADRGWTCTVLRRGAGADDRFLLVETAFLARDGKGTLRYETAWGPTEIDGMEELRPQRFRFVGFGAPGVDADAEEV